MEVKRREGESISAFLYRFSKKIQQSGILREAKKRRFRDRPVSKLKKRQSALHREKRKKEVEKAKKMGTM
ncbi:30S ribosomal protein S21 [Candidatus Wolfebacteria bacterium]|nr:30S ribosomal protein S21 [Candidatus Wolfebacteria bacterium]